MSGSSWSSCLRVTPCIIIKPHPSILQKFQLLIGMNRFSSFSGNLSGSLFFQVYTDTPSYADMDARADVAQRLIQANATINFIEASQTKIQSTLDKINRTTVREIFLSSDAFTYSYSNLLHVKLYFHFTDRAALDDAVHWAWKRSTRLSAIYTENTVQHPSGRLCLLWRSLRLLFNGYRCDRRFPLLINFYWGFPTNHNNLHAKI